MYSNAFTDASNFVEKVDTAFLIILGISFFFLIAITVVMIFFVIRYRASKHPKAKEIEGHTGLEVVWTVIPTILVIIMFYYGWAGYQPMTKAPDDAMPVKTVARMWNFNFEYENGKFTDTLYVPVGKPVKLDLVAMDVIHSLYIPAFRVKQDMVPGKVGMLWFEAGKPGTYDLFCTEYCGLQHSYMLSSVVVMEEEKFNEWLSDTTGVTPSAGEDASPAMAGMQVLRKYGCNACHSTDGSKLVGPSYKGLYGHEVVVIEDGEEKTVVADEEYIRNSIYNPNQQIVKGFNRGLMQPYEGQVTEEELQKIIEYFKTLAD